MPRRRGIVQNGIYLGHGEDIPGACDHELSTTTAARQGAAHRPVWAPYVEKHYQQVHAAHRHSFYPPGVSFTRGGGTHTIDFVVLHPVEPGQIYFMVPGAGP